MESPRIPSLSPWSIVGVLVVTSLGAAGIAWAATSKYTKLEYEQEIADLNELIDAREAQLVRTNELVDMSQVESFRRVSFELVTCIEELDRTATAVVACRLGIPRDDVPPRVRP